jgi:mannose-6-phosphate isomerase-like protein (cupin superfamily)
MPTAAITPTVETTAGEHYTVARLGPFDQVDRYEHAIRQLKRPLRGKVFLKSLLGLTGMEVSITKLPRGAAIPFLHRHRAREELYVFVGGRGQMQVDGNVLDVAEGTVVRVAPGGARTLRAAADEDLLYLCIQARQGDMPDAEAADDGQRLEESPRW